MKSDRSTRTSLLLATCLVAGCAQDPDLKSATPAELVRIATANLDLDEGPSRLESRATSELLRRGEATALQSLREAAGDPSVKVRAWGAWSIGHTLFHQSDPPLEEAGRSSRIALLMKLLGDSEEVVRAMALMSFGASCAVRRPEVLPDEVAEALRSLVGSERAATRNAVASTAIYLGPLLVPHVPELLARAVVEPDASNRYLFAIALSNAAPDDPAVLAWLLRLLDDTREKVRSAAAIGLGKFENASAPVAERLRSIATNEQEAASVRTSAAESLSSCVVNPEQAESALVAVLGVKDQYHEVERYRWIEALGRLASRAPAGESVGRARKELDEASRSEHEEMVASATIGLARMAFATRDEGLGKRLAEGLRARLPAIRVAVQNEEDDELFSPEMMRAIEAMVVLAAWPEMEIPVDKLRAVLEAVQSSTYRWEREWAAKQLATLP